MYISDLALNDFRSYESAVVRLEPGVNIFVGDNGQGKTNLVEAVVYLATFSSHRVAADAALVRQGASAGVIRAKVWHGNQSSVLELEILAGRANRARLNRGLVKPSELLGTVYTVLFSPEDLELVKGDPAQRRHFLDSLMVMLKPRMHSVKAEYEKVLRQRGALLKNLKSVQRRTGTYDDNALTVWDDQLSSLGSQIISARADIISKLRPYVEDFYHQVSGSEMSARIDYLASVTRNSDTVEPNTSIVATPSIEGEELRRLIEDAEIELQDSRYVNKLMHNELQRLHHQEIERGVNLVGPHRDDMQLVLGTFPARGFASHGESWSYALALKLASWKYLKESYSNLWGEDDEPILILDDVFAELDSRRRARLVDIVTEAQQVLVTAAVGEDLPNSLYGERYEVQRGSVRRLSEEIPNSTGEYL